MLTPVDIEEHFEKIDRRLDRIEQILPTLATKEDLREVVKAYATKDDLREAFDEAKRHARMLHEDLVERIKLLAEHRPQRRR